jgi:pimeloyl-ACP methyl ester carboxylesterase
LSKPAQWRRFDPKLYDQLHDLLKADLARRVTLAKDWGLIPRATYFEEVLGDGAGWRTTYFARANTVLEDCNLWFYDPDIGIEIDSIPVGRTGSSQYVYWTELRDAFQRGHSLLIYQQFPRVNRDRFIPFLANRLAEELGSRHVVCFRTAHVAFFLVGQERHADNLAAATVEIGARWPGQIEVWRLPHQGDVRELHASRAREPISTRESHWTKDAGESTMPVLSAGGVQLHWEETGQGAPMVWVHEYGGDLRSWEPQVRYFSRRYRIITYNQRGYPPSTVPKAARDYSQALLVEDLHQLLTHLRLGPVHLAGCSMGANVARDFALAHPGAVRSLILVGAGAGSVNREQFLQSQETIAASLEREGIAARIRSFDTLPSRASFKAKDPRGFAEFLRQAGEHDVSACTHLAREVIAKRKTIFELEAELKALRVPTLIMVGDRDTPCVEPSLVMRNWMPHAGLVVFPACGHTPNLEEPSVFNLHVAEFLAAVEAGRWAGWSH